MPLKLRYFMAAVVPAPLPSQSAASSSSATPAKRKIEAPEEETAAQLLFDVDGLYNLILFGLLDDLLPPQVAISIVEMNPEILSSLCHYGSKELVAIFQTHMNELPILKEDQKEVLRTLDILYTLSLRNSSFNKTTETLEREIQNHLEKCKPENFQALIGKARVVLAQPLKGDVEGIRRQLSEKAHVMGQISQLVDLYYLADPMVCDRVIQIYTNTVDFYGRPIFPNCKKHFGKLCQSLEVNRNARGQLLELRKELLRKSQELRMKLSALLQPSAAGPREKLLENNSVLFWQAGAELLAKAFKTTFDEKLKRRVYTPSQFFQAVNAASRMDNAYRQYSHSNLYHFGFDSVPERFVMQAWLNFLERPDDADVNDLMRLFLQQIPENTFQKLKQDLNTSPDKKKTVLDALYEYLTTQFRGKVTFISLKAWVQKTTAEQQRG